MSWITIVWSMNAAACLTLAGIYLVVWCKQRGGWVYLVVSCSAVAAAALTAFELALLRAQTTAQYIALLRWVQLPVWVLVVSLVIFVRLHRRHQQQRRGRAGHSVSAHVPESAGALPVVTEA